MTKQVATCTVRVPADQLAEFEKMLGKKFPNAEIIGKPEIRPTYNAGDPEKSSMSSGISG